MIFDAANTFDNDVALTNSQVSTNVLDMAYARDISISKGPLFVDVAIGTPFAAAGAATLNVSLQCSPDNVNWTTIGETSPVALAELAVAQSKFGFPVPPVPDGLALPRYYRLNYTVANGPFTAGTVTSGLVIGRQAFRGYANNYSV